MKSRMRLLLIAMSATFAVPTLAAVSAEEAKQLGTTLTMVGAEKAGNKEGTIPAYTGEGLNSPAGWEKLPAPRGRPDPFASEKPLFSITAQNAAQYADKLDGMAEFFKRYPNFRMDVYPSHRTSTVPKWVADNTMKNATACKGVDNDLKLDGCYGGYAFPIPKNGTQVMWNHLTTFTASAWYENTTSYIVANNGSVSEGGGGNISNQSWFYDPERTTPAKPETIYNGVRLDYSTPARRVGEKVMALDALDQIGVGRRAYLYVPGQRRVKLAPDLAYDTPSPVGGGISTMDDNRVFFGAMDRYDWKLVGKKEKFIVANNFRLSDHAACNNSKALTKNFMNPDCIRWELHRVWVVEAKLKAGYRHIYPHRFFYWDEDNYAAGSSEQFDASGKLWRFTHAISFPFYVNEGAGTAGGTSISYDLQTGTYNFVGTYADVGQGVAIVPRQKDGFFTPDSLAAEGIR